MHEKQKVTRLPRGRLRDCGEEKRRIDVAVKRATPPACKKEMFAEGTGSAQRRKKREKDGAGADRAEELRSGGVMWPDRPLRRPAAEKNALILGEKNLI